MRSIKHRLAALSLLLPPLLVASISFSPPCTMTNCAHAATIISGIGFSEVGDDTIRPTLFAQYFDDDWIGIISGFGRKFSIVDEKTTLFSAARKLKILPYDFMRTIIGLGVQDEYTKISDSTPARVTHNGNLGAIVGLVAVYTTPSVSPLGSLTASLSWTSTVYLAGFGGIFLAHSRTHAVLIGLGKQL